MTLANLINQLLASDQGRECEHNLVECRVVLRPCFGHGLYAEDMEVFSVDYDKDEDIIVVLLKDKEG